MSALIRKKRRYLGFCIVAAVSGSLVILAIAAAAFSFIRYRKAGSLRADASQSQVVISQPVNMAEFPAGSPIQVEVDAIGQQPFTSTELWINGVLEGVQAAPSAGLTTLTANFSWIPSTGGNFSLVARAVNQDNHTAVSPALFVFIDLPDYGNGTDPEAGKTYPAVFPTSPEGNPSPAPPAAGDVLAPAVKWQGSPAGWLTNLTARSAPAAPELVVTADGCSAKLDIHDLSDNEEGFALYRQTTNSTYWVHVADLASHPGEGWIEYQESNLAGGITYYVAAFNGKGETSSNLALLNIDPQACPVPQPATNLPVLELMAKNLSLDGMTGNVYCYTNLGGRQWSRWPEFGFLKPGQDHPLLAKPLLLASLTDTGFAPGPQSLDLKLECWGWQGGELLPLGNLKQTIDPANPQAIHAVLSGMAFDILPKILSDLKPEVFKLDSSVRPWIGTLEDVYAVENLGFVPESDQMPLINAWWTYDPEICKNHILEPTYQEVYCFPMPGYNAGPGGANPQPYLVWDVINNTCKADPEKECFPEQWWEGFTNRYPPLYDRPGLFFWVYSVYFSETGENTGAIGVPVELNQRAERILPDFPPGGGELCYNGTRVFFVQLFAYTSLGYFANYSNAVITPCPEPLKHGVKVDVTFNQMRLDNIDDDGDTVNDVYGRFAARVNGAPGPHLHIGWWGGESPPVCPFGQMCGTGTSGYIGSMGAGNYVLELLDLCLEEVPGGCEPGLSPSPYKTYNNQLRVKMRDGEALQLFSEVYDYDELSSDDPICNSEVWVGPRTLGQWAATEDEVYYLIQPEGDATCILEVIVDVVVGQ